MESIVKYFRFLCFYFGAIWLNLHTTVCQRVGFWPVYSSHFCKAFMFYFGTFCHFLGILIFTPPFFKTFCDILQVNISISSQFCHFLFLCFCHMFGTTCEPVLARVWLAILWNGWICNIFGQFIIFVFNLYFVFNFSLLSVLSGSVLEHLLSHNSEGFYGFIFGTFVCFFLHHLCSGSLSWVCVCVFITFDRRVELQQISFHFMTAGLLWTADRRAVRTWRREAEWSGSVGSWRRGGWKPNRWSSAWSHCCCSTASSSGWLTEPRLAFRPTGFILSLETNSWNMKFCYSFIIIICVLFLLYLIRVQWHLNNMFHSWRDKIRLYQTKISWIWC